jgi:hypothetical protein
MKNKPKGLKQQCPPMELRGETSGNRKKKHHDNYK